MKYKKLLSLIFIFAMLLVVAPYFVGHMAKENIEKQAIQVSKIPGYSLEIRDYDQGWFSSRAVIAYGFDDHTLDIMKHSAEKGQELDDLLFHVLKGGLVFDVTVSHGPITFQQGINFALLTMSGKLRDINHGASKESKEITNIDSLASLHVKVSYGGTTSLEAHSPAFKANYADIAGEKLIIDFAGMEIHSRINANLDEYEVDVHINQMSLGMADRNITLRQVNAHSNGHKINSYIWSGNGTSTIGALEVSALPDASFSVKNFTSDYDFHKESDTALTLRWNSNAEEVLAGDVAVKDIQLDLDVNHLDIEAITDYVKSFGESYGKQNGETSTQEKTAAEIQAIATRVGEKLIKNSPELIINNFRFSMNGGFFESDARLAINGVGLDNIQQLSDPAALNKRMTSDANIKFDKTTAQAITAVAMKKQMAAVGMDVSTMPKEQLDQAINVQTSMFLQNFVSQGYLKQNGDEYTAHFEIKDGQRLINGKPLPVPGM